MDPIEYYSKVFLHDDLALIPIMAWHWIIDKQLFIVKFEAKCKHFHWRKWFENAVCKMEAILVMPQCINFILWCSWHQSNCNSTVQYLTSASLYFCATWTRYYSLKCDIYETVSCVTDLGDVEQLYKHWQPICSAVLLLIVCSSLGDAVHPNWEGNGIVFCLALVASGFQFFGV